VLDDAASPVRTLPAVAAGALVFTTSACVLVLEILAGRLLAPYVGVTLQTYTGVIGTVLAGIALGTWWGGNLADRVEPRRIIGPLVAAGGLSALATVPLVRLVGEPLRGGEGLTIIVLSAVGFFLPAALLSAVTPAVVKLQLRTVHETGSVVGRLSALSTTGAIAGTFLAGFVLVAAASTTTLIVVIGVGLVVLGAALWWQGARPGLLAITALVVVGAGGGSALALTTGRPCDVETAYYCANVDVDADRPSGRLLVLDDLRHSYVDLEDPTHIEFRYLRGTTAAIDAIFDGDEPIDALHIGGGGFTLPGWLAATRPGTDSHVLELDEGIVELARDELGLTTGPDLSVDVGDARMGIATLDDDEFDFVMGDAFGSRSVPWHLTTVEFLEEVDRVLRADGVYMVNVIDGPEMRFAKAEVATLQEVFADVVVIAPPAALEGRSSANVVLVASQRQIDLDELAARVEANGDGDTVLGLDGADRFAGGARVLRDDFAPVDQYLESSG
jgi:spermidine synthase